MAALPGRSFPALGFDPAPGDAALTQALARRVGVMARELGTAMTELSGAESADWKGQAADAFRAHLREDVLPLLGKARDSFSGASTALGQWGGQLTGFQADAAALERQAESAQGGLQAATTALQGYKSTQGTGVPVPGSPLAGPRQARLQDAVSQASAAVAAIQRSAQDLNARYLAAAGRIGAELQNAGNMAPHPPGLFASLWHDVESNWDTITEALGEFVHDKALLEFISGVANIIATVAGLLALIPPLSLVFGPIALTAVGVAMVMDALLAGFDHGSWAAVALDAIAAASDTGWMKAASKLAGIYETSGIEMRSARTLTGLATGKKLDVAPGMFRMIADSVNSAFGEADKTAEELGRVRDLGGYGKWRALDITGSQLSWAASSGAIAAVPGQVRDWIAKVATGKEPWQESADKSTGL